jgi:hypothetical protein
MDYYNLAQEGCTSMCDYGRKCLSRMDIMQMGELRMQFWGSPDDPAKGTKERAFSIKSIFEDRHDYNVSLITGNRLP